MRGPGGWPAVAPLAGAAFLSYTNLASAQQTSTETTLSVPALTSWAGDGWQQIDGGNFTGTSYSHTGLTAGLTYYFAVRAVKANNETSPWSEYGAATLAEPSASTATATSPLAIENTPKATHTASATPTSTATPESRGQRPLILQLTVISA